MLRLTERAEGRGWKAGQSDVPPDTSAVRIRGSSDLTADVGLGTLWENSLVGDASRVIVDDGSIAELASGLSESHGGEENGCDD